MTDAYVVFDETYKYDDYSSVTVLGLAATLDAAKALADRCDWHSRYVQPLEEWERRGKRLKSEKSMALHAKQRPLPPRRVIWQRVKELESSATEEWEGTGAKDPRWYTCSSDYVIRKYELQTDESVPQAS
jgi:hypothetical protein